LKWVRFGLLGLVVVAVGLLIFGVESERREADKVRVELDRTRAVLDGMVATQTDLGEMETELADYRVNCEHELRILRDDCGVPCARCIESRPACGRCDGCEACPEPACGEPLPDAMCMLLGQDDTEESWFTLRLAFHRPGRGGVWLSTPDWRHDGQRFDSGMGLHLGPGDRRFLRNGAGYTTYQDMTMVADHRGNIAYRVWGQGKMLVCGELVWSRIRETTAAGEETP